MMLAASVSAGELVFTVNRLEQVQTFEAGDGFQLALLAQTPEMNIRMNKLTGRIKRHAHPQGHHFLYLIRGQVELTVGHETRIIGPGDFVTIPRGSPHSMKRLGDSEALFLDIASPPDIGDVVWHE
ncbi:MAG: cupin domain-containing protein [Nitrospinae bacterium]|nr:cupin domain-containing protein [Nitrospinota bacterium]